MIFAVSYTKQAIIRVLRMPETFLIEQNALGLLSDEKMIAKNVSLLYGYVSLPPQLLLCLTVMFLLLRSASLPHSYAPLRCKMLLCSTVMILYCRNGETTSSERAKIPCLKRRTVVTPFPIHFSLMCLLSSSLIIDFSFTVVVIDMI